MVGYVVMEILKSGEMKGLGTHQFKVSPRIGEIIGFNEEDGSGEEFAVFYQVAYVIHATQPCDNAGDILVKRIYDAKENNGFNNFYSELAKAETK